ncbi:nucleotide sugar dehydrogenase [Halomarina rubra]|uniref:UDP-N-acetyl-D-mannosamine dehydrogenase n=1 Tax=Halomarina rubra TaxID=2071873 RepID=A0ABD6B1V3_9EURY|nr:nucleotide sugar dehydrogenase [Halomarina rubra]
MTTVCVHGLGYVGLPTAALFAHNGYDVVGFDVDERKLDRLHRRDLTLGEADLEAYIVEALEEGTLTPSATVEPADVHLICVPTPLDFEAERADLKYVLSAADAITDVLREGDTVILESTVPPGTTEGPLREALERSGMRAGEDFYLGYSPETVLPGDILHELRANDRFVGGVDEHSTDHAAALYEPCIDGTVHRTPDATTAEFVKLAQNAYRDLNIGFANEMARIARDYGVDSRAAIALANRHSRVDILQPGPGVGGHCLPVDPLFFAHDSESLDLIYSARRVNDGMSQYVADILEAELGSLEGKRVAVLGVAYKANVDDTRNSPGLKLAQTLKQATPERALADGGLALDTRVADPLVDDESLDLVSVDDAVADADAIVVATDHDVFRDLDPAAIRGKMRGNLLLDTKGTMDADAWTGAGFDVVGL